MTFNIGKYTLIFSGYYLAILIFINILFYLFQPESVNNGANIAMLITAAAATVFQFTKEYHRAPTKRESVLLAASSTLASLAMSLLIAFVSFKFILPPEITAEIIEALATVSAEIWLFSAVFASLLSFGLLYVIYAFGAKRYAEKKYGDQGSELF